jgi:hypothetical protein
MATVLQVLVAQINTNVFFLCIIVEWVVALKQSPRQALVLGR